jgi:hypothetical protein
MLSIAWCHALQVLHMRKSLRYWPERQSPLLLPLLLPLPLLPLLLSRHKGGGGFCTPTIIVLLPL